MSDASYANAPNVMASKVRRWKGRESGHTYCLWAEDGVICMENQDTGEFHTYPIPKAQQLVDAFQRCANRHTYEGTGAGGQDGAWDRTEGKHQGTLVGNIIELIAEAKAQGDPLDEQVVEYNVKARKRTPTLLMPPAPKPVKLYTGNWL